MARRAISTIRAIFSDATDERLRWEPPLDPPAESPREIKGEMVGPGSWPGAPADTLPPDCPVVPLGINGKACYFVDTAGQLISVEVREWGKKMVVHLFSLSPNYAYWAWPRFSKNKTINGLEVDDAVQSLTKAAAQRGLFNPIERVRGRGAWTTRDGRLVWHSGDAIYMINNGKLKHSRTGEVDGVFYPRLSSVMTPWPVAVAPEDGPIPQLAQDLRSWTMQRPDLDPVLIIGWIGCALLGAALQWRPHVLVTGDKGVGKSTLQAVVGEILGDTLHASVDTTAAGIYQRVGHDCLPVALDEFEASADNRRVSAIIALMRVSSSGGLMFRGGAEHVGASFRLASSFLLSGIQPPPLDNQDKSRLAIINLGRIDPKKVKRKHVLPADAGRMMLRQLMDGWPDFPALLQRWREALGGAGLDGRGQDTYGTLLAVAQLLLGPEGMADFGLDVTEPQALGQVVADATAQERSETSENWRDALDRLFDWMIDGWKGGIKKTVGQLIEEYEQGGDHAPTLDELRGALALIGCSIKETVWTDADGTRRRRYLCVPMKPTPQIAKVYQGSKWQDGGWAGALKQAPHEVVVPTQGNERVVKINRKATWCLLVDLDQVL